MKIAIWHNLPSGGGKRALYNHVKVLQQRGHYLEAWTTDMSSMDYLPLTNLITENRREIKKEYNTLAQIKNPIKREQALVALVNSHCEACIKEIEAKDFDLIFANSCMLTYMPYIGKFTRLPKIVYLGEPYRSLYEAMPENIWQAPYQMLRPRKIKRLIIDFKLNYSRRLKVLHEIEAAKSYDKIMVNSLFSRENVIRSYGTDASVCYLGVDIDHFKYDNISKEPYVVGLGKISYTKSVHVAIEVIAEIPKAIRPVLKWISNGVDQSYTDEVNQLAKALEVNFQAFINVADKELASIVSRAATMIYTSKLEPFGLAPLEANACGTYVVAIAEGGVRESISRGVNGTLVNGYKKKEMAREIAELIGDMDLAKTKGKAAFDYVNENWNYQFMADNIVNEVEEMFQRVR